MPDPAAGVSWWQQHWPSPGFAPLDRRREAEVVVVGGGVSGCSTAFHLARAGARVILLEAREMASGASGRNGGFLLAGLAHRPVPLSDIVGEQRAAELYELTVRGREAVFQLADDLGMPGFAQRTGSLRLAVDRAELDDLDREAALLAAADVRVERLTSAQLPGPLANGHFLGGLRFEDDGRLVPAGWARRMARAAADAGAVMCEHSPVVAIEDDSDAVTVRTANGMEVRAEHAVVATEAWLSGLLPELAGIVLPYRSQVLAAAAPLDASGQPRRVFPHVTWSRRGWDYVQQAEDGTIVIGGEQLEDVELLREWEEVTVERDQRWLEGWLARVVGIEPEVVARWAGVLSQTVDGFPVLGPLPGRPRVVSCGGWGGAGNVLSFVGGRIIASFIHEGLDEIPAEARAARIAKGAASR